MFYRIALPTGFPKEYRFAVIVRIHNSSHNIKQWNLIQIKDTNGSLKFSIGFNPPSKSINFSVAAKDGRVQSLSWHVPKIFDHEWHKVRFGVFEKSPSKGKAARDTHEVALYLDCRMVGEPKGLRGLKAHHIDTSGELAIAKDFNKTETVAVDLQNMVITCNPERIAMEVCE